MIFFRSDYSQGAHPKVLDALVRTNMEHSDGYALDEHCENARCMIKKLIGREDCDVHLMVGGTPANITLISAALRPYQAAVAPIGGHIYSHETGAVEATGHRIIAMQDEDGKLTPELIDRAWDQFEDEHTVIPKLAYISNATENGSIYTKAELVALSEACKKRDMYLYMDGARIGTALTCDENDLTLADIAEYTDAFYIGGTKNGALMCEALVIMNEEINKDFRWMIKQNRGLLAKGRLLGVQFEALLEGGEDSVFFEMARHSNAMAKKLKAGLEELGLKFFGTSVTNQIFPIVPVEVARELAKDYLFYEWTPEKDGEVVIRLVTAWGTTEEEVEAVLASIKELLNK